MVVAFVVSLPSRKDGLWVVYMNISKGEVQKKVKLIDLAGSSVGKSLCLWENECILLNKKRYKTVSIMLSENGKFKGYFFK